MDVLLLATAFLIFGLWFTMVRPVRQRQRAALAVQQALHVGDGVMTTAGIFGTISWIEEQKIGLEVSPGVTITYARAAVAEVTKDETDEG
jgi:preprotein translocase subunit YajC